MGYLSELRRWRALDTWIPGSCAAREEWAARRLLSSGAARKHCGRRAKLDARQLTLDRRRGRFPIPSPFLGLSILARFAGRNNSENRGREIGNADARGAPALLWQRMLRPRCWRRWIPATGPGGRKCARACAGRGRNPALFLNTRE